MPGPPTEADVREILAKFKDPETGRCITQTEQVHDIRLEGDRLSLTLGLTTHSAPIWQETKEALEAPATRAGARFEGSDG